MANIMSKADFARRAGVGPSAVSKALSTALRGAITDCGRINADHPAAVRYLNRAGSVGRPPGGGVRELSKWVVAAAAELEALKPRLPKKAVRVVENVGGHIFCVGFAHRTMPDRERQEIIAYVEEWLRKLRLVADK